MNDFLIPLIPLPGEAKAKAKVEVVEQTYKTNPVIYKDSKLPFITNIYVASLTVIGLFIVFRFVQKSR